MSGGRCILFLFAALWTPASAAGVAQAPTEESRLGELSLEQLRDVPVTVVSRRQEPLRDAPAAVTVITPEMIRRSGATTVAELLRLVPGMDVARISNDNWAVSARGFNDRFANKLLVQVDGRVVYNSLFSGVYWDTVDYPLEDVERVEVVRGPGGSVWGANAVNGVVNIVTKPARATRGGSLAGGGGSAGLGFGSFRYGVRLGERASYRAYVKGFRSDKQFAADGDPNDAWHGQSAGVRLDGPSRFGGEATVDAGFLRSVAGQNSQRPQAAAPYSFINLGDAVTNAGHVLGRLAGSEESRWALTAYWDRFDQQAQGIQTGFRQDVYDLDFQQQLDVGERQRWVYGLGYRYVDAFLKGSQGDDGFLLTFPEPRPHKHLGSVFLQDRVELAEDGPALTLGSKFEHNDFTGFEVEPTARLAWTPARRRTLWAAVSRAVRTPNLTEDQILIRLVPAVPPVFPRLTGNDGMNSEELLAYEAGARAQPADAVTLDSAFFYNVYRRLKVTRSGSVQTGPSGTLFVPAVVDNGMDGRSYGTELAGAWQAEPWWRLEASYAFLRMELTPTAGIAAAAAAAERQSPRHQVSLRSAWDLPRGVELDLIGRFVDRVSGFNPTGLPGVPDAIKAWGGLDARLGWRPAAGWELALAGQNLLYDQHPEFGTNALVKSPIGGIRRAVYAQATRRW